MSTVTPFEAKDKAPASQPAKDSPATGLDPDGIELVDPRELLIKKPMPTRRHTVTRADGVKQAILLQGLTYLEKQVIDTRHRQRREEDQSALERGDLDTARPSMWAPWLLVAALRTPKGERIYRAETEQLAAAVAYSEQLADGEIQSAVEVVLELSGWGKKADDAAGKSSRRTATTAS